MVVLGTVALSGVPVSLGGPHHGGGGPGRLVWVVVSAGRWLGGAVSFTSGSAACSDDSAQAVCLLTAFVLMPIVEAVWASDSPVACHPLT